MAPHSRGVVVDWGYNSSSPKHPISLRDPFRSEPVICHLGNRCFCVIESTSPRDEMFNDEPVPIPNCRFLNVVIHKDLQEDQTSFQLKCLQQDWFTMETEFTIAGVLSSCLVLSNDSWSGPIGHRKRRTKGSNSTLRKTKLSWVRWCMRTNGSRLMARTLEQTRVRSRRTKKTR